MSTHKAGVLVAFATLACGPAAADEAPGLGEPLSAEAVAAVTFTILPDGSGLPPGSGSVAEGEAIYAQHCLACHGEGGEGGPNDRLVGGRGTLDSAMPVKTVGSYWPYATTLFDYLRRAMPYTAPAALSADELYAVTAYVLHLNDIVGTDAVLDAERLPAIEMPNREGFERAWPDP